MLVTLIVILILLVVAMAVVGYLLESRRRHQHPNERHEPLDILPLAPDRARDYRQEWEVVQDRFVNDPTGAVADADTVIEALMGERGYPVGDVDTKLADLSAEHADVLQHYRAAHEIAMAADSGVADAEELRRAMVHYRVLFGSLLDDGIKQ